MAVILLTLDQIRELLNSGEYELTLHATERLIERNISRGEIREAGETVDIIEDYPTDKYGPSCLLLGWTDSGHPLHIQTTRRENPKVKIIALYEPDGDEWIDYKVRRK